MDDLDRLDRVRALGVDEHVWQHAGPGRVGPSFATGILDLTGGHLPRVLDAFHVVRLGNQALDEVRRRVQQQQLGHRGHRDDPLYKVRRLLRRGIEHLTVDQLARIDAALQADDPDWEVTIAWHLAQQLRAAYRHPDPAQGQRRAERLLQILPTCPVSEARLGRTLTSWRGEYLAYFATGGGVQRAHRGDEPDHRETASPRPRLPQLRQLPTPLAAALQRRLADSINAKDQEASTTLLRA